ncbi:hypothetical protein F2P79_025214 [Pimephales promelas]|nr:hypothetical protein F2P79_025214 [Pimephales promelas]
MQIFAGVQCAQEVCGPLRIERTLRNQQPSCVPEGKPQPSNFQVAKQVLEEQVKWILLGKQRPWFQVFMCTEE